MPWNIERSAAFYNKEILKYPVGAGFEAKKNVVIDATQVAINADERYIVESGTVLVLTGGTNEVQLITVDATGGTFTISFGGSTTGAIAEAAAAATVQAALEALASIGTGNVTVTGSAGGPFTITFVGALARTNVAQVTTNSASLTGGAATATPSTVTPGVASAGPKVKPAPSSGVLASEVVGILEQTIELFGATDATFDEPGAAFFWNCIFDTAKLVGYSGNATAVQAALSSCKFES